MDFDTGTVQRNSFYTDTNDLLVLKLPKYMAQDAALCPAIHAGIDGMPVAEAFRQSSPFASMLGNIKNGIENLKIGMINIAALARHAVFDLLILSFGDFHHHIISNSVNRP